MADNRFNDSQNKQPSPNNDSSPNQTMQREHARMEVGGDKMNEQSGNNDRQEKSAIGGGQTQPTGEKSQTGEPGRARSELDNREPAKSTDQR